MAGHTSKSPSKFGRGVICGSAFWAEAEFPDTSSPYADEGTVAHWVIEKVGTAIYSGFGSPDTKASDFLGHEVGAERDGEEPRPYIVTQEMCDAAQVCLDYIARRYEEMATDPFKQGLTDRPRVPVMVFFEKRVSPAWALGTNDCDGTADCILLTDYEVEVVDYKHGKGVPVPVLHEDGLAPEPLPPLDTVPRTDPKRFEEQFLLYLIGVLGEYPLRVNQTARVTVVQPRATHHQGPIRSIRLGEPEISGFIKHARECTERMGPDAPRVASSRGCRFCKAKPTCKTYAVFSGEAVGAPTSFDQETFFAEIQAFATRDPNTLTPAEIVRILDGAELTRAMLKAVEEYAHGQVVQGSAPPELTQRYKLVRGRANRRWSSENHDSIATALTKIRWKDPISEKTTGLGRKQIFEEKLRSPAQVESLLKQSSKGAALTATHWDAFNRLVEKPEGSLQLVPITDPRPAAGLRDAAAMFSDIPEAPPSTSAPVFVAPPEVPETLHPETPPPAAVPSFDAAALFQF